MTVASSDIAVFCGLDVGKGEHHAAALSPAGTRLHDKKLPNTEARLRELFTSLAGHGPVLVVVDGLGCRGRGAVGEVSPMPDQHEPFTVTGHIIDVERFDSAGGPWAVIVLRVHRGAAPVRALLEFEVYGECSFAVVEAQAVTVQARYDGGTLLVATALRTGRSWRWWRARHHLPVPHTTSC